MTVMSLILIRYQLAIAALLTSFFAFGDELSVQSFTSLPEPVANNAVTSISVGNESYLVSFAGIGEGRTYNDTHARTFVYSSATGSWSEAPPVPGNSGRLAAVAATVGELAYVFGGYSVAEDGAEVSTSWAHSFDPQSREYSELSPMPVPVDDAVAVSFAERYIYLISGWHDLGNVNLTQRFDTVTNSWAQATPVPGAAVFGHAGGITGNRIVYCDGVAVQANEDGPREFVANSECYLGIIDEDDSRRIDWRPLAPHPGRPRYRMAAAGINSANGILFVGGTENPYNYNGIGYDGNASEPAAGNFLFSLNTMAWDSLGPQSSRTMDHRGLIEFDGRWLTVGGMLGGQKVTSLVNAYSFSR